MTAPDIVDLYPIDFEPRTEAWELHDTVSGEIVSFDTEASAIKARAFVITLPGTLVPMDAPGRIFPGWAEFVDVMAEGPIPGHPGRGMQAQARVDDARDLDSVLRYTGGEYPVSGDASRLKFPLWREFRLPSLWSRPGVHA